MKKLIIFLVLLVTSVANAGTVVINFGGTPITLTSTANQDAAIDRIVAIDNAGITAQNAILAKQEPPGTPLPLRTRESFIRDFIVSNFQEFMKQQKESNKIDACDAYNKLGATPKGQIDTALGGKSPCS